MTDYKECPLCRGLIKQTAIKCRHCKRFFDRQTTDTAPEETEGRTLGDYLIALLLSIIVFIVVTCFLWAFYSNFIAPFVVAIVVGLTYLSPDFAQHIGKVIHEEAAKTSIKLGGRAAKETFIKTMETTKQNLPTKIDKPAPEKTQIDSFSPIDSMQPSPNPPRLTKLKEPKRDAHNVEQSSATQTNKIEPQDRSVPESSKDKEFGCFILLLGFIMLSYYFKC